MPAIFSKISFFFASIALLLLCTSSASYPAVKYGISVGGNRDYPGSDYLVFEVQELDTCVKHCADDARCLAFSYDPRVLVCRLKDSVPNPVRARRIKSGRKLFPPAEPQQTHPPPQQPPVQEPPSQSFMEIFYDTAFYGDNYRSLYTENFENCSNICRYESQCMAFTYEKSTKGCFLKSYISNAVEDWRAISGQKLD